MRPKDSIDEMLGTAAHAQPYGVRPRKFVHALEGSRPPHAQSALT